MAQITDARKSALAHEVRAARSWDEVFQTLREWQREQFPNTTAASAVKHLAKEIKELEENPENIEEWVDALHLVMQGLTKAAQAGLNPQFANLFVNDLPNLMFDAFKIKLHHNIIERQWAEPDADGVVEHVREFPGSEVNPF